MAKARAAMAGIVLKTHTLLSLEPRPFVTEALRGRKRSRPFDGHFSNVAHHIAAAHPSPLPAPERKRARCQIAP